MVHVNIAAGLLGLTAALAASTAYAATEISWWHAMGGELGTKLEEIVAGYNASQTDYHVTPGLQGHLSRDHDRRHRRLPRQRAARTSCRSSKSAPAP